MSSFTPIVTLLGQGQIADAIANEEAVNISHMAVGDGGGAPVTPLETMTALTNEVWRGSIQSVSRDLNDPTRVIFTATIPLEAGPFVIREIALFSQNGQMFAIGAYPEQFKPTAAQGAVSSIQVEFVVIVSETAQVTVTVNPSQLSFLNNFSRIPFYAVDAVTDEPPSNPAVGAMVVVGTNPQSAFFGNPNRLAQWNGSVWLVALPPVGTVVGVNNADADYLRWDGSAWVPWLATQTKPGLVKMSTFTRLPIYPEFSGGFAEGKFTIDVSGGDVVIDPGQKILWRGHQEFDTTSFSLGDRSFSTEPIKKYHLVWWAPGHGTASNAASWPSGRFALYEESDPYFAGLPETHELLDSTYDRALVALVETNSIGLATVTALSNLQNLRERIKKTTYQMSSSWTHPDIESHILTVDLNWARRPRVTISQVNAHTTSAVESVTHIGHGTVFDDSMIHFGATGDGLSRYGGKAWALGYVFNPGGAQPENIYSSLPFELEAWA
ncbi:MAG: phage tail protein [Pararhodobacter sp.]